MSCLVSRDGKDATEKMVSELQGGDAKTTFDPLLSLNSHFSAEALRCGGLYIMGQNDTGENDGHICPVCEFVKHAKGFDAKEAIGNIADQMAEWARSEGMIPALS